MYIPSINSYFKLKYMHPLIYLETVGTQPLPTPYSSYPVALVHHDMVFISEELSKQLINDISKQIGMTAKTIPPYIFMDMYVNYTPPDVALAKYISNNILGA